MFDQLINYLPAQCHNIALMSLAFILTLPIAWERSHVRRNAGLRTFPLVAIVSCAFVLVGIGIVDDETATARIIYGVITGIGFIGGGAIIKYKTNVMGTATAASIWCAGAIGVSVATRNLDMAVFLAISAALSLAMLARKHDSDGDMGSGEPRSQDEDR